MMTIMKLTFKIPSPELNMDVVDNNTKASLLYYTIDEFYKTMEEI